MSWIAGIDGCRAGWFVVLAQYDGAIRQIKHTVCTNFQGVLDLQPRPSVITIDIPIGLLDTNNRGGRDCDIEARELLGWPRRNSVFSPPIRPSLLANSYEEANRINGMSQQAYGILPKIKEVDDLMESQLQNRIFEVHPEVTFWAMAGGRPMDNGKKKSQGREERLRVLEDSELGTEGIEVALAKYPRKVVAHDDVLDAYAALWTAARIHDDRAKRIPENPPLDSKGLRMEIWY